MTKAPALNPLLSGADQPRRIRSFVLRGGRLTDSQRRAIDQDWPKWGLEPEDLKSPQRVFGPDRPIILDIGFGNGESLVHMARQAPDCGFVGIEVYAPGLGAALIRLREAELDNVRLVCADATDLLGMMPDACLAGVRLYFPDPWPKKKHHKRRIVQAPFLREVIRVLADGGHLHMATDWQPYAEHMCEMLEPFAGELQNQAANPPWSPRPPWRPETKFERRGRRLGHEVYDLLLRRSGGPQ